MHRRSIHSTRTPRARARRLEPSSAAPAVLALAVSALAVLALAVLATRARGGDVSAASPDGPPDGQPDGSPDGSPPHELRRIRGWAVHVDASLLAGEHAELGANALDVLEHKLHDVLLVVPDDKHAALREVPIWLDRAHALRAMQYHPSRGWLESNGHDPRMEKCVHVPRAAGLVEHARSNHQPCVMLHELAHAYHDRVLGFDHAGIRAAWDRIVDAKSYESVLHIRGKLVRHYALENHKEFFAEATECYFGTNDFYPFVRSELEDHDPETYRLLEAIWGKQP